MAMMQESFVFSGNIMDNIRYGRPDATDEECIAAARSVYANIFIERLPNGYYTRVEEQGAGLSAGERQLLSFARIILADLLTDLLDSLIYFLFCQQYSDMLCHFLLSFRF